MVSLRPLRAGLLLGSLAHPSRVRMCKMRKEIPTVIEEDFSFHQPVVEERSKGCWFIDGVHVPPHLPGVDVQLTASAEAAMEHAVITYHEWIWHKLSMAAVFRGTAMRAFQDGYKAGFADAQGAIETELGES